MRKAQLRIVLLFALAAFATPAYSQLEPTRRTQPSASKQTGITQTPSAPADYNLGLIVKKVAALEAQVALLKKQNETLAGQFSLQQKANDVLTSENKALIAIVTAHGVSLTSANKKIQGLEAKFDQLDSSYQSHTHYMPSIGQQALSSVPGMQDIANKSGVGYVKPQWENILILSLNQYSKGIAVTGPIYKQP